MGAGTNFLIIVLVIAILGVGLEIVDPNFFNSVFGFQGKITVTTMGGNPLANIAVSGITINGQSGSSPFTVSVNRVTGVIVSVPQSVPIGGTTYTFSSWSTGETVNSITVHVYVTDVQLFAYYSSSVPPPPPQYLFSDGFESGSTSKWTGTAKVGTGLLPLVTTSYAHLGTYSCSFSTGPSNAEAWSTVYKTFSTPLPTKLCVKAFYYVPDSVLNSMGGYDRFYPIRIINAADELIATVGLRKATNTSAIQFYLGYAYRDTQTSTTNTTGAYSIVSIAHVPLWSVLELMWDQTTNTIQVWATDSNGALFNGGAPIISQIVTSVGGHTANLGISLPARVDCGIYRSPIGFETPWSNLAVNLYMDDIVMDTNMIPTSTSGSSASLSLFPIQGMQGQGE